MNSEQLKAQQTPLKARYKEEPAAAQVTMHASGTLGTDRVTCNVSTPAGVIEAGLHPMAGGEEQWACSGEILLQSLVACAEVHVPFGEDSAAAQWDIERGGDRLERDSRAGHQRLQQDLAGTGPLLLAASHRMQARLNDSGRRRNVAGDAVSAERAAGVHRDLCGGRLFFVTGFERSLLGLKLFGIHGGVLSNRNELEIGFGQEHLGQED